MKNWKRRFFKLTRNSIEYWVDSKLTKLKGKIPIKDIKEVTVSSPQLEQAWKRPFLFQVSLISVTRIFYLQAENTNERSEWINTIKNAISFGTENPYQGSRPVSIIGPKASFLESIKKSGDQSASPTPQYTLDVDMIRHCTNGDLTEVQSMLAVLEPSNLFWKTDTPAQAFCAAASKGHIPILDELLKKGVDVNIINDKGYSAIHMACSAGYYPTAQFLLQNGANANKKTTLGVTPIHSIAYSSVGGKSITAQNVITTIKGQKLRNCCTKTKQI